MKMTSEAACSCAAVAAHDVLGMHFPNY